MNLIFFLLFVNIVNIQYKLDIVVYLCYTERRSGEWIYEYIYHAFGISLKRRIKMGILDSFKSIFGKKSEAKKQEPNELPTTSESVKKDGEETWREIGGNEESFHEEKHYKNGKMDGEWTVDTVDYKNGKLDGEWTVDYPNGRLEGIYENGKPVSRTIYDENGKPVSRIIYDENGEKIANVEGDALFDKTKQEKTEDLTQAILTHTNLKRAMEEGLDLDATKATPTDLLNALNALGKDEKQEPSDDEKKYYPNASLEKDNVLKVIEENGANKGMGNEEVDFSKTTITSLPEDVEKEPENNGNGITEVDISELDPKVLEQVDRFNRFTNPNNPNEFNGSILYDGDKPIAYKQGGEWIPVVVEGAKKNDSLKENLHSMECNIATEKTEKAEKTKELNEGISHRIGGVGR